MLGKLNDREVLEQRNIFRKQQPIQQAAAPTQAGLPPTQTARTAAAFSTRLPGLSSSLSGIFQDFTRLETKLTQLKEMRADTIEELNLNFERQQMDVKISAIQAGLSLEEPGAEMVFKNLRDVNDQALARLEERFRTEKKALKDAQGIKTILGGAALWASIVLL
jgi:hypothetical protein